MVGALGLFVVDYPLVMALAWIALAVAYTVTRELPERWLTRPPQRPGPQSASPIPVSVLIPCFNEGETLGETIESACNLDWPDWEVIAINDGSHDDTGAKLDALTALQPKLRVVHLASNQGKALALRAGALLARHELLLCIDADALLDQQALAWMVRHFVANPRIGAVTGNPRIRNRTSLLGRLQVGEFSMIIGLIKRAQSMLGGLFCVSGVIGLFRRSALSSVDFWSSDCLTEDIDITWKLQRSGWQVAYEPHALIWILMPETLRGLWKQRLRWAQGGQQVLFTNADLLLKPRQWHLLPLLIEPLLSLIWAYALVASIALSLVGGLDRFGSALSPHGLALLLLSVSALQFTVSFWLDRPYDRGLGRNSIWMIWYPFAFWLLCFLASVVALPTVVWSLLQQRQQPGAISARARWVSPDRGRRS
jgi:biofilm PGA synthesis N-glycosyltransferase PgaC